MPPPAAKEKSIGEERVVNFTGAGLALGEELDVDPATGAWAQGLPEDADKPQALAGGRLRVSASPRLRVSASPRLFTPRLQPRLCQLVCFILVCF